MSSEEDGRQRTENSGQRSEDGGTKTEGGAKANGNGDAAQPPEIIGNGYAAKGGVKLEVVEPWPEPVNGAELLDEMRAVMNRFVVFPKYVAEMLSLWNLHTFAYHLRNLTTYLAIESPEKECGKSTLLTVLSQLVYRPVMSSNISSSAFFHAIEELKPTLLMDEGDSNLRGRREMRGIFNAGYTHSTSFVWRLIYKRRQRKGEESEQEAEERKSNADLVPYSSWCPKAIATIGHLDDTLRSRCIVVRMQRKIDGEECARLKFLDTKEIKRKCARFVLDHAEEIANAEPAIPKGLTNRAADIWEPLLVLADLAGGQWPELARRSAEGLTMRAQQYSPIGSLLMDIATIFLFNDVQRLFSRDIAGRVSWDTGAKRALQVRNELKSPTIPGGTPSRRHFGPRRRQCFEQWL